MPVEMLRFRIEDSIKLDLKEIGVSKGNWTLDRDYLRALVNAALNLLVS